MRECDRNRLDRPVPAGDTVGSREGGRVPRCGGSGVSSSLARAGLIGEMKRATSGDAVTVHYTGKLAGGEVFDTTRSREPVTFRLGSGEMLTRFEEGLLGLSAGESRTVHIPAESAYGPRREEMVFPLRRDELPGGLEPALGMKLRITEPDGSEIGVTVLHMSREMVTVDANHPLAGQDLIFDIELIAVE